jgi:3-oxoacyl-[acyl-carrier-protein] synthase II
MTVCTGSASGADAIGLAIGALRQGDADIIIAGGAETPFILPIIALFNRVEVLSKQNEDPETACRPFDRDRDGFVLGEGSAFMVLETEEHASRRGARIRGLLAGYGQTCDAHHMNAPDPEGQGAAEAIGLAINEAGVEPDQVDYINAHGTATRLNDPVESKAIQRALGNWGNQVPVSSTKPITGHLLGASGALEAVITLLTVENQALPPNLNLENLDSECTLNIVTPPSVETKIECAVTNSYGFGGKNSTLIFRRFHG